MLFLAGAGGVATASVLPSPLPVGKKGINPSTGKPIVSKGAITLSDGDLQALIARHGFSNAAKAFAIAKRESGGNVGVVVNTLGMTPAQLAAYWGKPALAEVSVGLWQINVLANGALVPGTTIADKIAALQDAETNASVALALSSGGASWGPWGG